MLNWAIEGVLSLIVAFQLWLLRSVWNTKPSRDEVRRMFEEFEERDREDDKEQIQVIADRMMRLEEHLEREHRENLTRFDRLGDKLDDLRDLLTRPKGH